MSIRIKLLISYFILVVMAVLISYFTSITLIGVIIDTFVKSVPGAESRDDFHELFNEWGDIYVDVAYLSKHEPSSFKDTTYLEDLNTRFTAIEIGYGVVIDGEVTYMSDRIVDRTIMEKVQLMDLADTFQKGKSDPNTLDYNNKTYFIIGNPLAFPDNSKGMFYVIADVTQMKDVSTDSIRGVFSFGAFLAVLLIIALLLVINRMIIKPLKELDKGTKRIREGNLEEDVPIRKKDEIGKISQAFNIMRKELKTSIDKQVIYEENRKELISSISHDLKTPITSIKGYVEGIRDGVADTDEKRAKYLDVIYTKSMDMDRLIDDLFLFSKLDLNRLPFEMKCIDALPFFEDCVSEIRMDIEKRGIIFSSNMHIGDGVKIYVDQMNLKRVILNVVQNAIKYMDKTKQFIEFSVTDDHDHITVSIKDNGKGIEEGDIEAIFEKFYRADKSRNTQVGGSGLGLAIAKQMIESFNGHIWATSDYGSGSAIHFTINKCNDEELIDEADINY